jgi:hypothetical protein
LRAGTPIPVQDLKPRLELGLYYASGDGDPSGKNHNPLVNLYPTNHKFYGAKDFLSWQNLIDPYFKASITPVKDLSVALTYNLFWLATTSDFFYQVNQSPRTTGGCSIHPQNGSFAGQQIDLVATCQPAPCLQVQPDHGHYFAGDYVNRTFQNLGDAHDANWVYLQAQFDF